AVGRNLVDIAGLGRRSPSTGAAMVVFLLSLVGVPPLAGFVGKLLLFGAAMDAGFAWLAVVGIVNAVLSLAVYLRVIVPMYQQANGAVVGRRSAVVVWRIALVLTVALGVMAEAVAGAL
ncbi:MAG: NADH-quinone oxidoreductase subunit, partial [Thermomicrobiales bacterium]|nr:NADH-quinone oxidoreductase subunit [Thermomicrobiales bacterium]